MKDISFRTDILPLKDKLYRLALRITLNAAEAEDVVQDTMLRLWDRRAEWPSIQNIEAFATTICRNLAIDRSQKLSNRNLPLDEGHDDTAHGSTPYEELSSSERITIVRNLIEGLPEVQRSIIQLRDIEGHSYAEIADIMKLSEEQVKVYLFRARQKIKKLFTKIEGYGL